MKKSFLYKLIAIALVLGSITSCDELETAEQDASAIESAEGAPKAIFSTSVPSGSAVSEGDTIICNISIDKMLDRSLTFSAKVIGGTSNESDIEVTAGVINPYSTEASVMVVIPEDWDAEEEETMQLEFGLYGLADKYLVNQEYAKTALDLTVSNYVSDAFTITLEWDKEINVKDTVYVDLDAGGYTISIKDTVDLVAHAGSEVDYDFLVCPVEDFDFSDPWGSAVDYAATGDHPEVLALSGLEDGEYYIAYDFYANGLLSYFSIEDPTALLTVTSTMTRQGTDLNTVVVQDDSQSPTVVTPGYADNHIGRAGVVAKLIVDNGNYSIVTYEGEGAQSFRLKSFMSKNSRPAHLKK